MFSKFTGHFLPSEFGLMKIVAFLMSEASYSTQHQCHGIRRPVKLRLIQVFHSNSLEAKTDSGKESNTRGSLKICIEGGLEGPDR